MTSPIAMLDPAVKHNLQKHLSNMDNPTTAIAALKIGTKEQLRTVAKILSHPGVLECFGKWDRLPYSYPRLLDKICPVACVERVLRMEGDPEQQVYAVYSLKQMQAMEEERHCPTVRDVEWCALEIPENIRSALS